MNNEEQRIALCEWMGWRLHLKFKQSKCPDGSPWYVHRWIDPKGDTHDFNLEGDTLECLPDTNSLDVLHEMEKKLKASDRYEQQFSDYLSALAVIVNGFDTHCLMVADAAQRREALCRTLWPERFGACADTANPAP